MSAPPGSGRRLRVVPGQDRGGGGGVSSGWYARIGKRWLDFSLALVCVAGLALPALAIAGLTLLLDGGPVLFRQERVGRGGRRFWLWKFRSMRAGPPHGSTVTVQGDARVTRWGSVLRRWKLDELPQFVNVLKGEMSFVGPRPDVPGYADRLEGDDRALLELRPGITGPATLVFAGEERLLAGVGDPTAFNDQSVFPAKTLLNRRYAAEVCLTGDLVWMACTVAPGSVRQWALQRGGWFDLLPEDLRVLLAVETGRKRSGQPQAPARSEGSAG